MHFLLNWVKCETEAIRERMLGILSQVDKGLAAQVAYNLGLHVPQQPEQPINQSIPADGDPQNFNLFKLKAAC